MSNQDQQHRYVGVCPACSSDLYANEAGAIDQAERAPGDRVEKRIPTYSETLPGGRVRHTNAAGKALLVLTLLLAIPAAAVTAVPCTPTKRAPCTPPTFSFVHPKTEPPFDAPVRFGELIGPGLQWRWIKAGESSRPCNAAERARAPKACDAKVGDPLFVTLELVVTE